MEEEQFRCSKCGAITNVEAVETIQYAYGIYDEYSCRCHDCNYCDSIQWDLTPEDWKPDEQ